VKRLLKSADAVCFDVDSTVIEEEGIDMLAAYKGAGNAVAELTKKYNAIFHHILLNAFYLKCLLTPLLEPWEVKYYFKMLYRRD